MRTILSLVALGLVPLAGVTAQETAGAPGSNAGSRVAALNNEYRKIYDAAVAKLRAAQGDKEAQAAAMKEMPSAEEWGKRYAALAEELKGDPAAIDCWIWVVQRDRQSTDKALAALQADYMKSERLAEVCQSLGRYTTAAGAEDFLEACQRSEHAVVRGQACFALAGCLKGMADMAERLKADAAMVERLRPTYGQAQIDKLLALDTKVASKRAEKLLEEVLESYGDLKARGKTLAQAAEGELFELRNLSIGRTAPDIEGEDADGVAFKLSDYRGKVVMLDFWGDW